MKFVFGLKFGNFFQIVKTLNILPKLWNFAKSRHTVLFEFQELHDSAEKVVSRGQDLVRARRVEKNIATTIESLSMCLPVLQTLSKLSKQMKEKRFHPALKTLEQLEHTYLPRIANYRWRCTYWTYFVYYIAHTKGYCIFLCSNFQLK